MTLPLFDFAKVRLAGDWQQRIQGWMRSACTLANKSWIRDLSAPLEVQFLELDTGRPGQILPRFPDAVTAFRVNLAGDHLGSLAIFSRPLFLAWISMGTLGINIAQLPKDKELSTVEERLAEYLLTHHWLPNFRETWPAPERVSWEMGPREPNPHCSRMFASEETLVLFSFKFKAAFGEELAWWVVPKQELEHLLGPGFAASSSEKESELQRESVKVDTVIPHMPMKFTVRLGSVELKLSQLSNLREGDVIVLNQRIDEPLTALVEDKKKFVGWAGRTGAWQVFRVQNRVEE